MKHNIKKLLTLLLTFALLFSVVSTQALATSTSGTIPFVLSHLTDLDGNENLIVTILESSDEPILVQLITEDGTVYEDVIDLDYTNMVEFKDLDLEANYTLSVESKNPYSGEISLIAGEETVSTSIQDSRGRALSGFTIAPLLLGGTYQAKTSAGANIGASTSSLWKAIETARAYSASGTYVQLTRSSGASTVWTKTTATRFYQYQFDTYYGYASTASAAQSWVNTYNYSHAINGAGYPVYDYVQKLKGTESTHYENNVGGFYYNFSANGWGTYRKMATTVDLRNATFKTASAEIWNGYMYLAFKQEGNGTTFEGGLQFKGTQGQTKIYPYLSYYQAGSSEITFLEFNNPIDVFATATVNSDGSISFNDEIKLTLCMDPSANGSYWLEVYNVTTGKWKKYAPPTSQKVAVNYSAGTRWMSAVSLVPYYSNSSLSNPVLNNLRSGAYMNNVKLTGTTLYPLVTSATGSAFHPGVSTSVCAFLYNTDCIGYSRSGTTETYNIFYNRS